jgi:type I restriction enzyme S subunit
MNKVRLSDIAFIKMGQSPLGENCNEIGKGVPLLNGPTEFTNYSPVPKQFTTDSKRMSETGEILFCVRGSTTGRMNWSDRDYSIGRGLAAISHKKGKELNHFLKYLITSNLGAILRITNGSTFPNLTTDMLASFEFIIPEISIQYDISKFLSSLDSKIEINNRINAELEAMAKTLYDYWFVQFDFPDETGKPYKSNGGKMVWNKELKREIPEGWEVKGLFEAMDVQYGFPFSTSKFTNEITDKPVIRIRDILENTISTYTTENIEKKHRLKKNDLLIGMDGNFHLNFWDKEGAYLNQRSVRIRSKLESDISNLQAYFELTPHIKAREKNVSRTTVGHLSDKDLKRLFLISPKKSDRFKTKELFDSILSQITSNRLQNQQLSSLRDWLLPMLMNGQVKVV